MLSEKKIPNRLVNEKSPYLLQHAYNPVNWWPWCDEAFAKAKAEDKPIFLSIGYSTCHWCHVMERESFEDEEVADILNRAFVSIKVDREERPDVDSIYMNVCQMLTGSGGWPLSIFMDSGKRPFFAGTYFPKEDRMGMTGFLTLLSHIEDLWSGDRGRLVGHAEQIISAMKPRESGTAPVDQRIPDLVFDALKRSFDRGHGGFSYAPKFPTPHNLLFLMRYHASTGDAEAVKMCRKTLDSMRRGGIFDHIGFGFSRYSTDGEWLVPHFEKMLYDNALLTMAYTEFYSLTKEEQYARTAREIIAYLMDKMRSENGGFYSAEDADSEGVEGKFYVFTPDEVRQALGKDADEFCRYFDITEKGNFEGKSIPNLIHSGVPDDRRDFADRCRASLNLYREKRIHPHLDDKILTSWNGLVIAALAIAGRVLGDEGYLAAARQTAGFFLETMTDENGKLLARYRDGDARFLGRDEDYAYLIWGLIELYQSTYDAEYLRRAQSLNEVFMEGFFDEKNGGFYQNDQDAEKMLVRLKLSYDGATPSANAVHCCNLIRLSRLTHDEGLEQAATKTIESFMEEIASIPTAYAFHAMNILYLKNGGTDVVLRAKSRSDLGPMAAVLHEKYLPFTTVKVLTEGADPENAADADLYGMVNGLPTAYVCRGFSCAPPVTSMEDLKKLL